MPSYSPGRPPNERDTVQNLNGAPVWLGMLVSTGAAVNNATTATTFNSPATSPQSLQGTLAGRMLMVQPTAAGSILPSTSTALTLILQTGTPSLGPPIALPGPALLSGERVIVLMAPNMGWLQWLPTSGPANLLVWELV